MDRRDAIAGFNPFDKFDADRMIGYIDDIAVRCEYEVCGTCHGRGTHVNPGIDSQGLSYEDFNEDPDFAEQYFSGAYDQTCNECKGNRVVPVPVDSIENAEGKKAFDEYVDGYYEYMAERDAERRAGC